MIDAAPILKIVPIFAAALIAPGPDFLMISSLAMSRGRMAAVMAALGIAAGVFVYVLLSMFGLGLVFAEMKWLVIVIRSCGGLYLIYMGFQLWKASMKPTLEAKPLLSPSAKRRNPFVMGFFTNMTNPKAIAFFTSIFALTLPLDAPLTTDAAIILVMCAMPILWFSIVSVGLSTPAMKKLYLHWSRWLDRVAGTFLAMFGLRLLFSGKN